MVRLERQVARAVGKTVSVSEFDKLRANYEDMSWAQVSQWYRKSHGEYPELKNFSVKPVLKFFSKARSRRVLEIGGADGSLAKEVLSRHPKITVWGNYELDDWSNNCGDSRYYMAVPDRFVWDMNLVYHDTMVMSHVMEHISKQQCEKLPWTNTRWVYIDYPERPVDGWSGTCAHVNEMNVDDVENFMNERGFNTFMKKETGTWDSVAMGFKR